MIFQQRYMSSTGNDKHLFFARYDVVFCFLIGFIRGSRSHIYLYIFWSDIWSIESKLLEASHRTCNYFEKHEWDTKKPYHFCLRCPLLVCGFLHQMVFDFCFFEVGSFLSSLVPPTVTHSFQFPFGLQSIAIDGSSILERFQTITIQCMSFLYCSQSSHLGALCLSRLLKKNSYKWVWEKIFIYQDIYIYIYPYYMSNLL